MILVDSFGTVKRFKMARTVFGRPLYFTAAYWVDGLLVDTGCAHCRVEFLDAIKGLPVTAVVNTHSHEDHIGADAALARRLGIRPLIHPDGLGVLADPRGRQPLRPYQRVMWGYPEACTGAPIPDILETENHRFRVVHTPGHSPDHIVLFEPDRGWLFTGDAYIGGRDSTLRADYDIRGIIRSLHRMRDLGPGTLFTASGSVRENGTRLLEDKVEYLETLGARIGDLADRGLKPSRIGDKLLKPARAMRLITMGHFSGRHLVRSFLDRNRIE